MKKKAPSQELTSHVAQVIAEWLQTMGARLETLSSMCTCTVCVRFADRIIWNEHRSSQEICVSYIHTVSCFSLQLYNNPLEKGDRIRGCTAAQIHHFSPMAAAAAASAGAPSESALAQLAQLRALAKEQAEQVRCDLIDG